MAGYKGPRELITVAAGPHTAAGKPDVGAARALFTPQQPSVLERRSSRPVR